MASIGHLAVGMACGRAYANFRDDRALVRRAMIAFSVISLWPDIDALGFAFGVRYSDPFGHRGATHSLTFAVLIGLATFAFAKWKNLPAMRTALFAGGVAASHCLLDTMTYGGGLGCALLWPFTDARFWAPVRFIPIAPIGLHLFSPRGLYVMAFETILFSPFFLYALFARREAKKV
jgi:inner membrane protein